MKWIALTGGIACGKSSVSEILKRHAIPVIDADQIAYEVVLPGTPGLMSVSKDFGPEILLPDGTLDRVKLGQKIFENKEARKRLEALLHPLIRQKALEYRSELEAQGVPVAIYDIPLLFETKSQGQFDKIIVVTCHPEQQRQRLRDRNNLSEEEIQKRLNAQIPLSIKESEADFVIWNTSDKAHLEKEVQRLQQWLETEVVS